MGEEPLTTRTQRIKRLKQGYAHILDTSVRAFDKPGFVMAVTRRRVATDWADSAVPIWFFSTGTNTICSVAPEYADKVDSIFGSQHIESLIAAKWLEAGQRLIDNHQWSAYEVFTFLGDLPPQCDTTHQISKLSLDSPNTEKLMRNFDGDIYAIVDEQQQIQAHAGLKNLGIIQEMGILTQPQCRGQSMGKAVVAHATAQILAQHLVPVYIPNRLDNAASYALAKSLGYEKVGEMLMVEYRTPDWAGYTVHSSGG
jgi:hypothetical protein